MKENGNRLPGQGSRLRKRTAWAGTVQFCTVLYGFLLLFDLCLVSRGDDIYLETGIADCGSLWAWVKFWGTSWSGRVLPQGILVWLMQFPPIVFHLVNAGVWVLLLWGTLRCLDRDAVLQRGWGMVLLLCGIFLLIPSSVLDDSVYWKCANVSYLWGTAAMMTAIFPLVRRLEGRACSAAGRAAAVIACIYAAGFEQSGALMSGLMVCFLIGLCVRERRCDFYALWMTVLSCTVTAGFFLLPGNAVRAGAETIVWFPNYDMYSLPEQLLLGIQYAISRSMQEVPELLLIIALLNLRYVMRTEQPGRLRRGIVFATVVYWACSCFNTLSGRMQEGETYLSGLVSLVDVNTVNFGLSRTAVCGELLAVCMLVLLGMSTALLGDRFDLLSWGLFFGGLASMAIMGFSPTIYASAERPRFIGYFCLLCCMFTCIIRNRQLQGSEQGSAAEGQNIAAKGHCCAANGRNSGADECSTANGQDSAEEQRCAAAEQRSGDR